MSQYNHPTTYMELIKSDGRHLGDGRDSPWRVTVYARFNISISMLWSSCSFITASFSCSEQHRTLVTCTHHTHLQPLSTHTHRRHLCTMSLLQTLYLLIVTVTHYKRRESGTRDVMDGQRLNWSKFTILHQHNRTRTEGMNSASHKLCHLSSTSCTMSSLLSPTSSSYYTAGEWEGLAEKRNQSACSH